MFPRIIFFEHIGESENGIKFVGCILEEIVLFYKIMIIRFIIDSFE